MVHTRSKLHKLGLFETTTCVFFLCRYSFNLWVLLALSSFEIHSSAVLVVLSLDPSPPRLLLWRNSVSCLLFQISFNSSLIFPIVGYWIVKKRSIYGVHQKRIVMDTDMPINSLELVRSNVVKCKVVTEGIQ